MTETLRERIAQALAALRVSVHTAPWVEEWDGYVVRLELGRVNAETLADAVLPIVEEETKALREKVQEYRNAITWDTTCFNCSHLLDRCYEADMQREVLRDKVKTLADEWERNAGGIEVDRITGTHLRNSVRRLRALVEEPQGGER